jgi:hypothetical protein
VLLPRGGIPSIARRRSQLALTLAERENTFAGNRLRLVDSSSFLGNPDANFFGKKLERASKAKTKKRKSSLSRDRWAERRLLIAGWKAFQVLSPL